MNAHLFSTFDDRQDFTLQQEFPTVVKVSPFKPLNRHASQCHGVNEITPSKQMNYATVPNIIQFSNLRKHSAQARKRSMGIFDQEFKPQIFVILSF
jgi:hypothetical protein